MADQIHLWRHTRVYPGKRMICRGVTAAAGLRTHRPGQATSCRFLQDIPGSLCQPACSRAVMAACETPLMPPTGKWAALLLALDRKDFLAWRIVRE